MSPWRSLLVARIHALSWLQPSPLAGHAGRGFTLVELLVVVLIIGILAAIALPRLLGQRTRAKNTAAQAAVRNALLAARSYYTQNSESYAGLGPAELKGYESSLSGTEPADTVKPGDAGVNPQDIWIGNGLTGVNPTTIASGDPNGGSTVVLCSVSRGDTVYCAKDSNGVASYYAFTGTGVSAGADGSLYSGSGWSNPATITSSGFAFRKKLTIKTASGGAGLGGSLSDFPVAVVVNTSSWPTQTERDSFFSGANNVAGKRVQFRSADGSTILPYEVEGFTASSQAIYWVKVPALAVSDSSNYIWLYYGSDPNGSNQDQPAAVWDSGFKGVWHFNGSIADSTSNTNDLNQYGTASYTGGMTGSSLDLPGNNTSWTYLRTDTNPELQISGQFTIEAWDNADGIDSALVYNVGRGAYSDGRGIYLHTNNVKGGLGAGWVYGPSATRTVGATEHVVGTYDGTYMRMFLNGSETGSTNVGSKVWSYDKGLGYPNPPVLYIAADHENYGSGYTDTAAMSRFHDGRIEEVRISSTARSADWLKATYFSMKKTSWPGDGWLAWDAAQNG